jgi:hypothetical protein
MLWVSLDQHSRAGYREDDISMSLWTFRVPGYSNWANQCTCYIPVLHEQNIQGSIEEISLGFLRRHLGLQQDMVGEHEAPG